MKARSTLDLVRWHAAANLFLLALFVWPQHAQASDGALLWGSLENGLSCGSQFPAIISDGNGGAIVVSQTIYDLQPLTFSASLSAKHIGFSGNTIAVQFVSSNMESDDLAIAPDGGSGVLVAWMEGNMTSPSGYTIYAQHLDANLTPLWGGSVGVAVSQSFGFGSSSPGWLAPRIVSDGIGGAYVGWGHRLAHVQAAGTLAAPGLDGVQLTPGVALSSFKIVSDRTETWSPLSGGVIAAWIDDSDQLLAQRYLDGPKWTSPGIVLGTPTLTAEYNLAPDGSGGVLVAWVLQDGAFPSYHYTVRAQRLDANGTPLWNSGGVVVVDSAVVGGSYSALSVASDDAGGAIIVWADTRNQAIANTWKDTYGQRVDVSGNLRWSPGGVLLPYYLVGQASPGDQPDPQVVSDTRNGALVAFSDSAGYSYDIDGCRLNSTGVKQWSEWIVSDGWFTTPSDPGQNQYLANQGLAFDASGPLPKGAVIAGSTGNSSFCQKVEVDLALPVPMPAFDPIDPDASPFSLTLRWSGNYALEEAASIPNWSSSDANVTTVGSQHQAVDLTIGDTRFYRLRDNSTSPPLFGHAVGYLKMQVPGGWSMISNPFERVPGAGTLNDLFKLSKKQFLGTTILRYSMAAGFTSSIYYGAGGWFPNLELPLGEGIGIGTAGGNPLTLHMAGPLACGKPLVHLPAGVAVVAPPWPVATDVTTLNFPATEWAWIFTYNNAEGFIPHTCVLGIWWRWQWDPATTTWVPIPFVTPSLAVGEAFWSWRSDSVNWLSPLPLSCP